MLSVVTQPDYGSGEIVFIAQCAQASRTQHERSGMNCRFDADPTSGQYAVFNAAQVDGYTPKAEPDGTQLERIEQAETFFTGIGANLRHGGHQAFYSPSTDHIQMPPFQAFKETVSYYSTLAHEHTHWTARQILSSLRLPISPPGHICSCSFNVVESRRKRKAPLFSPQPAARVERHDQRFARQVLFEVLISPLLQELLCGGQRTWTETGLCRDSIDVRILDDEIAA